MSNPQPLSKDPRAAVPEVTSLQSSIVQLDWSNDGGVVTVTPANNDRFNLKVQRVIEACREAVAQDEFRAQFQILLQRLALWISGRSDIRTAYVTIRDGRLAFIVVRKVAIHDPAFDDSLSGLDLEIANDPDLDRIRLDTLALPPAGDESLSSFLDRSMTLAYRGKRT
jgi:hypothetical protein